MKTRTKVTIAFAAAGLLAVLGAILPWASSPFVSVAGTDTSDGKLTAIAGLVIVGIAVVRWNTSPTHWTGRLGEISAGLLGLLILYTGVTDILSIRVVIKESEGMVSVGSGLYVTVLAGVTGIGALLMALFIKD